MSELKIVMRRNLRFLIALAFWVPIGVLAAAHLWGWLLVGYHREPSVLANTPLNVSRLSIPSEKSGEPAPSWKFVVLGDLGNDYDILSYFLSQMKRDDIRFVIICGDLVHRLTPEQYEYLHLKIAQS